MAEGCLEAKKTVELINTMLGIRSVPQFNQVNNLEIVLLMDTEEEAARFLSVDSFSKGGNLFGIRRWKLVGAGSEPEWLKLQKRMVDAIGLP